ncbi:hypothetical protein MPER_11682 [Moniliophthora perniciosa FA553]|nr:hypothetical protein MPER_11682 [Moniliophthora perniciosa FA553]
MMVKRSGVRSRKYQTRLRIAATMHQVCRESNNEDGQHYWSFVLRSLAALTPGGMSDEEDGEDGEDGERVKLVHEIDFRHPGFRQLFETVDNTRNSEPALFKQAGRKRMRRVPSGIVVERSPPSGLATAHFRPEFLDAMKRGSRPMIEIGEEDYPVSRLVVNGFA